MYPYKSLKLQKIISASDVNCIFDNASRIGLEDLIIRQLNLQWTSGVDKAELKLINYTSSHRKINLMCGFNSHASIEPPEVKSQIQT